MILNLKTDLAERRSFLDPHGGKATQMRAGLARAAIVTVARDQWNRYWVLDAWAERARTVEMVDQIILQYHHWHPSRFGIECAGQQTLFVDTTREILRLRGESFIPIDGIPVSTRTDKLYRVRTALQPIIAEHRLFVRDTLIELRTELASFPTGATVDIVDALAGCISLFPIKPMAEEENEMGDDLYREFLREQGLDNDTIESRIEAEDFHEEF